MIASKKEFKKEFAFFFIFALAIWFVNMHHVDLMKGTMASEWMTAIGILEAPKDYPNSLQYDFFHGINTFTERTGVWMNTRLGFAVVTLEKMQVFAQTMFTVFGIWLLCISLGRGPLTTAISILLVFSSCMTWLGRYLHLQVTFVPTHSAVAFATGLFIIGLFANGKRVLPLALASLLFIWHPSHAAIISFFMWAYMAMSIKREGGLKTLLEYAVLHFVFMLPAIYMTLPQFREMKTIPAADVSLWWDLIEARTTNLFPLDDGAIIVANTWLSLAAGYFVLMFSMASGHEGEKAFSDRGVRLSLFIVCWVIFLWATQIVAAHFLHLMPIARLALTRCTPYAVVFVCIFLSASIVDLWKKGDRWPVIFALICVLFGFLVRLQAPVLVAFSACYASRFTEGRRSRFLLAGAVFCVVCLLMSGFLIHALDTFSLFTGAQYAIMRKACSAFLFLSMISSCAVLVFIAFLLVFKREAIRGYVANQEQDVLRFTVYAVACITLVSLSVNFIIARSGYRFDLRNVEYSVPSNPKDRMALQEWARESTPRGSMFVFNPLLFAGFEQTAHRPGFMSREEIHYPMYAIWLLEDIDFRLKLLGVDVSNDEFDKQCGLIRSLKIPRCRQSLFFNEIKERYPEAVISNREALLSRYKNARYIVIEKGKTAPSDFVKEHPVLYKNRSFTVYGLRP